MRKKSFPMYRESDNQPYIFSDKKNVCPECGNKMRVDEGQVDEDFMGNAIEGWWYMCYPCGISSQIYDFDSE